MNIAVRLFFCFIGLMLLVSCDHDVTTETTVHADGRLDKTFVFGRASRDKNIVGLDSLRGWSKTVRRDTSVRDEKYVVTFTKHFSSAGEANLELATPNDSLLRITSRFEKTFRWFYTHVSYSETIHALNWLELKHDDYLTREDFEFIDRLPAEGKYISKADSLFLSELNRRIYDIYGTQAMFEEYMTLGREFIAGQGLEARWADTLRAHRDEIFGRMQREKDGYDNFLLDVMDSLGIPLQRTASELSFKIKSKELERKLGFISRASEGKYRHIVHMPWDVISSDADSIAGRTLIWSPPSIKFLLKDYIMSAEAREPNYLIWFISGLFVAATLYLVIKRR